MAKTPPKWLKNRTLQYIVIILIISIITAVSYVLCYKKTSISTVVAKYYDLSNREYSNSETDIQINNEHKLREYEIKRLNDMFDNITKYGKRPTWRCTGFIKTLQKLMKKTSSYYKHIDKCLNIQYSLDAIINNITSYHIDSMHIKKRNETELMIVLFFSVMYDYNIKLHLWGSSSLAYHRNCNPLLIWDHDFDFSIFYDDLNESLFRKALDDSRLSEYNFTLYAHRRGRISGVRGIIKQYWIESPLFGRYTHLGLSLSFLDIFVIHRTPVMYFVSNFRDSERKFWFMEPYYLRFENITLKYTKTKMNMYVPQPAEPNILLFYGANYRILPWEVNFTYIFNKEPNLMTRTMTEPIIFYHGNNTMLIEAKNMFFLDIAKIESYCYL